MKTTELNALLIRPAGEEDFDKIHDFLLESSHLYPGIESWWQNRVHPTVEQGKRIALVVDSGTGTCFGKMFQALELGLNGQIVSQ